MFDSLSDRLQRVMKGLRGEGHLTEFHVDEALKEIRTALLEADVHLDVVKGFTQRVREKAVGQEVLTAFAPAQQVLKIVQAELVSLLGGTAVPVALKRRPSVILLVGLQGSGKTTTAAKLALHLKKKLGKQVLLVPADVYRPAATEQLRTLAKENGLPCFDPKGEGNAVARVKAAVKEAKLFGWDVAIVDTAGRLHVDDALMDEVARIREVCDPDEVLFVADSMTGQDAVLSARAFADRLPLTGVVLTKMDGDARGGAALSIRAITGVPIKFIGTGEKLDAIEPFYPNRLAGRILGMGDVLSLIERAQEQTSEDDAKGLQDRMLKGQFNLEDFLDQLQKIKKMGPLTQLLDMIPGLGQQLRQAKAQISDDDYKQIEAIIFSMTPEERRNPSIIGKSRSRRIAKGSGRSQQEIKQLLKQFEEMQRMMSQMGRMAKKGKLPRGLAGGNVPFDLN